MNPPIQTKKTPHALALMGRNYVAQGRTRDEMLADANKYIDSVLAHPPKDRQ